MFTQQECQKSMSPILTAGLPAAGLTRTFPQALVYGPWQWGGLNIPNLFMEQTTKHIHTLLKFGGDLGDMTGGLIQATEEAFRLEAGFTGPLSDFPEKVYSYVTPTWISRTWEVCQQYHIHVSGPTNRLELPCQADIKIMRMFLRKGYHNTELQVLNKCRMYLQVTFLSDICKASGRQLDQNIWKCPTRQESPHQWPIIPAPTPAEWRAWQQAIQQTTSVGRNLTLPLPLGKWFPLKMTQSGWFYHASKTALYHSMPQGVTRHSMVPRRSRAQAFHRHGDPEYNHPPWETTQVATV